MSSKIKTRKSSVESSTSAADERSVEELVASANLSVVTDLRARLSIKNGIFIEASMKKK